MDFLDPTKLTDKQYAEHRERVQGTVLELQPVRVRFTPAQRTILTALSDGLAHDYKELLAAVGNGAALGSLRVQIAEIRRTLRFFAGDIICVFSGRQHCYQQVRRIEPARDGVPYWIEQEFVSLIRERDGGLCQRCGSHGSHLFREKSWEQEPALRLDPNNARLLCGTCQAKYCRIATVIGRPRGATDDPTKRAAVG